MTDSKPGSGDPAGAIELHFCNSCGISIPHGDIEAGKARPAPGGYICTTCADEELSERLSGGGGTATMVRPTTTRAAVATAPPVAAAPPSAPPPAQTPRALMVLVVITLLYLVGATSFLLYREAQRKEVKIPELELPDMVAPKDVQAVADAQGKLGERLLDGLKALHENDVRLRGDLDRVSQGLHDTQKDVLRLSEAWSDRDRTLETMLRALASKGDLDTLREMIRKLEGRISTAAVSAKPNKGSEPVKEVKKEEPVQNQEVQFWIKQLLDSKAKESTRYSAAVELGHLKDASALPALVQALEKDPDDLVQRGAAWALGQLGAKGAPAVASLIKKMGGQAPYVDYMCDLALQEISKGLAGAAKDFGFSPTMKRKERQSVKKKWNDWWEKNKASYGVK